MADLNVERKKKTSFLPWLLLALAALILIFFLTRNKDKDDDTTAAAADSTTTQAPIGANTQTDNHHGSNAWASVDLNGPSQTYDEITNKNIQVRGNDNYAVYDVGENILFAEGKSEIQSSAVANLKEVSASIKKRFGNGQVRLYGFADAQGDEQSNLELSRARAEAVRKWMVSDGGISEANISVNAQGESNPKASNQSEAGRKENRRVQIVAKKSE